MKKKFIAMISVLVAISLMIVSLFSASAAVYVQDGKFKYQLISDDSVSWAGYTSSTVDDVTVPRYYDGKKVIGVANFALENNSSVRTIDFMESPDLSAIGMYAFSGCSSLESVIVPDGITTVDISAFRDCSSLNTVEFYGNNNSVPVECFYNCASLENVRLSAFLNSIQSHAFVGCTSLQYLELLDTVQYIAPNAFENDDNLTLGVYYGTYSHNYAVENNIKYKLLDTVLLGDVSGDGIVNINDVTLIQSDVAEMDKIEGLSFYAADTNRDGKVDIADATVLQAYLAEYSVQFPIGESVPAQYLY